MTVNINLNIVDFSKVEDAEQFLRDEGFTLDAECGHWRSADGKADAVIKERFRDGRFYIVLFM